MGQPQAQSLSSVISTYDGDVSSRLAGGASMEDSRHIQRGPQEHEHGLCSETAMSDQKEADSLSPISRRRSSSGLTGSTGFCHEEKGDPRYH